MREVLHFWLRSPSFAHPISPDALYFYWRESFLSDLLSRILLCLARLVPPYASQSRWPPPAVVIGIVIIVFETIFCVVDCCCASLRSPRQRRCECCCRLDHRRKQRIGIGPQSGSIAGDERLRGIIFLGIGRHFDGTNSACPQRRTASCIPVEGRREECADQRTEKELRSSMAQSYYATAERAAQCVVVVCALDRSRCSRESSAGVSEIRFWSRLQAETFATSISGGLCRLWLEPLESSSAPVAREKFPFISFFSSPASASVSL